MTEEAWNSQSRQAQWRRARPCDGSSWRTAGFLHALQCGCGRRISFLEVDAPVAERFERNMRTCHRANDVRPRPYDTVLAVEILNLGKPVGPQIAFHLVHACYPEMATNSI